MKLTNKQLRQIIKEELEAVLGEQQSSMQFIIDRAEQMKEKGYKVSDQEINMVKGAIQKYDSTGKKPNSDEMRLIADLKPMVNDPSYKKYMQALKLLNPELAMNSAELYKHKHGG